MRAILTYHSLDRTGSVISLDPDVFRAHVAWLASSGLRVMSVTDLLAAPADAHAVALTFDDAYASFHADAWPALRAQGFPATVFVPTAYVGTTNAWAAREGAMPALPLLSWDLLGEIAVQGVELAAHTHSHPDLRRLTTDAVAEELDAARNELRRRTGALPTGFAYPYGYESPAVVQAVRPRFAWACTTRFAVLGASEDLHRLPRLDTYYFRDPRALAAWGTRRFRLRVRLRALARRARRLARP